MKKLTLLLFLALSFTAFAQIDQVKELNAKATDIQVSKFNEIDIKQTAQFDKTVELQKLLDLQFAKIKELEAAIFGLTNRVVDLETAGPIIIEVPNDSVPDVAIPDITIPAVDTKGLAFPSARGAGAYASGGRGGYVYHVTNLEASGEGSFNWALTQPRPATIVFDVSGVIDANISISGNDLTIAGQSAPLGGITIAASEATGRSGIRTVKSAQSAENIIIRYLRFRPQHKNGDRDAFEIWADYGYVKNIIIDHCSASYGGDECFTMRGGGEQNTVTFQNLMIAEAKTGSLFGDSGNNIAYDMSYLNSTFFNISHRTPNTDSNGRVDIFNNYILNWQYRLSSVYGDIQLNHMNNHYAMGSRTGLTGSGGHYYNVNMVDESFNPKIYTQGNYVDKDILTDADADNRMLWAQWYDSSTKQYQKNLASASSFTDTPYEQLGKEMVLLTGKQVAEIVPFNSGAIHSLNGDGTARLSLDVQDAFYREQIAKGEGSFHPYTMFGTYGKGKNKVDYERTWWDEQMYADFIKSISTEPINTRPKDFYVSNPHIPEAYFKAKGITGSATIHNTIGENGRTLLEDYLNEGIN